MLLASGIELPAEAIAEICRRYYVHELSVFGSAARGDMTPESDIDILVEFKPDAPIGLWEFGHMERDLGVLLGRKVDLVSKHGLSDYRLQPGRILGRLKVPEDPTWGRLSACGGLSARGNIEGRAGNDAGRKNRQREHGYARHGTPRPQMRRDDSSI